MIFKSRQVNLDPEPYVDVIGNRFSVEYLLYEDMTYDPRPEFEPTRDPYPWLIVGDGLTEVDDYRLSDLDWTSFWDSKTQKAIWAPRREQFDTPLNRVLVEFRQGWSHDPTYGAANWLISLDDPTWDVRSVFEASWDEIEHARKVLTRLGGAA